MEDDYCRRMLLNGLCGNGSHVAPSSVLEGLDWAMTAERPNGAPHSIWQILNHLIYWQEFCLALLRDEKPAVPEHASDTWPDRNAPTSADEWNNAVKVFLEALRAAEQATEVELKGDISARLGRSRAEVMGMMIGHNSYHLGQIVLLRQMLESWPPPSGGDTW